MPDHAQSVATRFLKGVFLFGAAADAIIAVEWYLISLNLIHVPVHPSFYVGVGTGFRYALSIGSMFMLGWAILLYWGSRAPWERRGLLAITALMLLLATVSDYVVFARLFTADRALLGAAVKLHLVALFAAGFYVAARKLENRTPTKTVGP